MATHRFNFKGQGYRFEHPIYEPKHSSDGYKPINGAWLNAASPAAAVRDLADRVRELLKLIKRSVAGVEGTLVDTTTGEEYTVTWEVIGTHGRQIIKKK